jgi:hypothetical protein
MRRDFPHHLFSEILIMSISTRHSIMPFVSGETAPMQGQRLAKVGYKDRGENKAKFPSIAISVPFIDPTELESNFKRLLPHFGTFLEGVQDSVIRSLHESSGGTLREVSDDDIGITACLNYLEAASGGTRLSAETIRAWFVSDLQDNLSVMIAEKLGFEEMSPGQMEVIAKKLHAYAETFCMLAGKSVSWPDGKLKSLKTAVDLAADSELTAKITRKITELAEKPAIEELL